MPESGADRLRRLVADRNREQAEQRRPLLSPNQVYMDAVWASGLTSTQKITALCYGNHAYNFPERDRAWVVYQRLMPQTGIRSRQTIAKVHTELVTAGWLEPAGPRPGHKQITVYLLALPPVTDADIGTGTESGTGTDNRTGADSGPNQYGFPPNQYGNPHRTSPESGTRLSLLQDPPKDPLIGPPTSGSPDLGDDERPVSRTLAQPALLETPEPSPRVDAAVVVAAFIDGAVGAGQDRPTSALIGKVGRDAKRLMGEGVSLDKLTAAATAMGRAGWSNLDTQLQRMSAQRANTGRPNGNGHQTYRDPDRAAYYQGSL